MKKIVLILAGALCLGTAAVQAQDQAPAKDSTSTTIAPPQPPTQPSSDAVATTPAYRKDMTKIENTEVPAGLKTRLDGAQFKGWENGAVYSNTDKSVFIVEVKDETEGRLKVYRFDANGKPITDN